MFNASLAFHPLGSCSNARLSELLLLLEPVRFRVVMVAVSDRFRGRPRSMILPDSDWCLLCPRITRRIGSLSSVLGVVDASEAVSFGVPTAAASVGLSHGLGDARCSTGADNGVGSVEDVMAVVAADLGVVSEAESGVKGVLTRGDSSVRAERMGASTGVLPDRRRLREICRVNGGTAELEVGITSGVRLLGDNGCRGSLCACCSSSLLLPAGESSSLSAGACSLAEVMQSPR